eukprot:TRINITY_DN28961_c0_g1_i1.p1 TRINITY_DN28961_c0_g1~~TRINITY_DN28961_c0_g1_i1.p1  ORF type:complete len:463 (+),score=96.07 TRINITY_DN28961_c0_g1_i1:60-1391(+)
MHATGLRPAPCATLRQLLRRGQWRAALRSELRECSSGAAGSARSALPQPQADSRFADPKWTPWQPIDEQQQEYRPARPRAEMLRAHIRSLGESLEKLDVLAEHLGPSTKAVVSAARADLREVEKLVWPTQQHGESVIEGWITGAERVEAVLRGQRRAIGALYVASDVERLGERQQTQARSIEATYRRLMGPEASVVRIPQAGMRKARGQLGDVSWVMLQCGARRAVTLDAAGGYPLPDEHAKPVYVVLDEGKARVSNLGSISLTCHTLGARALVWTKDTVIGEGVLELSAGAIEKLDVYTCSDLAEFVASKRAAGFFVVGTVAWAPGGADGPTAVPLREASAPADRPLLLLLGSDADGLSPDLRGGCDLLVSLPPAWAGALSREQLLRGPFGRLASGAGEEALDDALSQMSSLNVAVVAPIALRHFVRQRSSVAAPAAAPAGA